MPYSLLILWREKNRYLPAILAVGFSALLITLQMGLLLGLLIYASLPIDHSQADLWVTTRDAPSLSLSQPFPASWEMRVAEDPGVVRTETYLYGVTAWHLPGKGSSDVCCVIGARLEDGALGLLHELTPRMRAELAEPGAVVVDEQDLPKLGLAHGVGETAEVSAQRVRVVGLVHGFQSVTAPYVFCSQQTARMLLPGFDEESGRTMYVLARCREPAQAAAVAARLNDRYPDMATYPSQEFSLKTRVYWLLRSKAGTAMTATVVLALLVGLVVTSQTLYAATVASLREYGVLDALGISRRRLVGMVLAKSFWIGLLGVALSLPTSLGLAWLAQQFQTPVLLFDWVLAGSGALTMVMALASGVAALRSLRLVEPASLLR
jgi:putative ABC transport system permease protein